MNDAVTLPTTRTNHSVSISLVKVVVPYDSLVTAGAGVREMLHINIISLVKVVPFDGGHGIGLIATVRHGGRSETGTHFGEWDCC